MDVVMKITISTQFINNALRYVSIEASIKSYPQTRGKCNILNLRSYSCLGSFFVPRQTSAESFTVYSGAPDAQLSP